MALSSYPNSFGGGVLLKEVPLYDVIAGSTFWVDSGAGGDGNPGTFTRPLATLDAAINKCTASAGDRIYLKPGHTEVVGAAGAIAPDVIGVTIEGLGHGDDQGQLRWTAAAGTMTVSAAAVRFLNVRFTAAVADVTSGIAVSANDVEFHNCRFDEEVATENWVLVMAISDGVDNFVFEGNSYHGNDGLNDTMLVFSGTHENVRIIDNTFTHSTLQTSTSAGFITSATQMVNCLMLGNRFHTESAAAANAVVEMTNATNNGWAVENTISTIDGDASKANAIECFDVTGLMSHFNFFTSGIVDTHGLDSFTTVDDMT